MLIVWQLPLTHLLPDCFLCRRQFLEADVVDLLCDPQMGQPAVHHRACPGCQILVLLSRHLKVALRDCPVAAQWWRMSSSCLLSALSEKWTSFYVLYSGGHKCNSLWGVSLRSGVMQIWRKAPRRNRINVILRLTRHASKKMKNTGGDRSSNLQDPNLVLYHCATLTLAITTIIKIKINIFCHFSKAA